MRSVLEAGQLPGTIVVASESECSAAVQVSALHLTVIFHSRAKHNLDGEMAQISIPVCAKPVGCLFSVSVQGNAL